MPDKPNEPDAFLLAEYNTLSQIEISRNDRLDRFITLFMTIAGAPFAVYSFVLGKEGQANLLSMPGPVACLFLLASVLGFLIVMIIVQIRLNIILYVRAANAIRGHFSRNSVISHALLLPGNPRVPPYYEGGKHTQQTVIAMALVNALYLGLAAYSLLRLPPYWHLSIAGVLALVFFFAHLKYYSGAANNRESKDHGPGKLHFHKPEQHSAR
ncbi:MAG TPA: hypothetical protein VI756_23015 [Blastocatellia bacterium]